MGAKLGGHLPASLSHNQRHSATKLQLEGTIIFRCAWPDHWFLSMVRRRSTVRFRKGAPQFSGRFGPSASRGWSAVGALWGARSPGASVRGLSAAGNPASDALVLADARVVGDHAKRPSPAQARYQRKRPFSALRDARTGRVSGDPCNRTSLSLVTGPPEGVGFQPKSRQQAYRNWCQCLAYRASRRSFQPKSRQQAYRNTSRCRPVLIRCP